MDFAQEPIFIWLSQFAYEPLMVYWGLVGMMLLSAIGFPLPEEVTLVSVGILAFMGANPHLFPPPYAGAPVVNVHEAALIAFLAVFAGDFIIYILGRVWGRKLLYKKPFNRLISENIIHKVETWTHKYGVYTCGIFRFTPGIRFPGHLITGMMKFSIWKFALVDGVAAAISVPTQIYLLAFYGDTILTKIRQFKLVILSLVVVAIVIFIVVKLYKKYQNVSTEKN